MNPTFILPGGVIGCVLCKQAFNETGGEHLVRVHGNPQVVEEQVREAFNKSMKDMKEFNEWRQRRDNS